MEDLEDFFGGGRRAAGGADGAPTVASVYRNFSIGVYNGRPKSIASHTRLSILFLFFIYFCPGTRGCLCCRVP
jgi:hypothetical protein